MCIANSNLIANNGNVNISTGNPSLTGTGNLGTVLTANGSGTTVVSITVKAVGNTSAGMVRLFLSDGTTNFLFKEICIPENIQTAVFKTFSINLTSTFNLKAGYSLLATTQNSDSFNIMATGVSWVNCLCA